MAKKKNDSLSQAFRNLHKEIAFLVADRDFYRELSYICFYELSNEHWFDEDVEDIVQHFSTMAKLLVKDYTDEKYLNRLEVDFVIGTEQEGLL
jgi:hypothetical protein